MFDNRTKVKQRMPEFKSLPDAIITHVVNGATVCLEGFTHLIPFAAGHNPHLCGCAAKKQIPINNSDWLA